MSQVWLVRGNTCQRGTTLWPSRDALRWVNARLFTRVFCCHSPSSPSLAPPSTSFFLFCSVSPDSLLVPLLPGDSDQVKKTMPLPVLDAQQRTCFAVVIQPSGRLNSMMTVRFRGNNPFVGDVIFLQPLHCAISIRFRMIRQKKEVFYFQFQRTTRLSKTPFFQIL